MENTSTWWIRIFYTVKIIIILKGYFFVHLQVTVELLPLEGHPDTPTGTGLIFPEITCPDAAVVLPRGVMYLSAKDDAAEYDDTADKMDDRNDKRCVVNYSLFKYVWWLFTNQKVRVLVWKIKYLIEITRSSWCSSTCIDTFIRYLSNLISLISTNSVVTFKRCNKLGFKMQVTPQQCSNVIVSLP